MKVKVISNYFNVKERYHYYPITCTGKQQSGLSKLKLYETTLLPSKKKDKKGETGDQGERALTGASGHTLQTNLTGNLAKFSDGLGLLPRYKGKKKSPIS